MKKLILAGATDQTLDVFILDSTSTTGAGKTGLAYNTASLVCYYRKGATGSATALTLATQTVGGAHSDGGFVEIDGTNMPGMYRLDLSDTIVATAGSVTLMLKGATGMVPLPLELQVVAFNPNDGVRLGLTALPNAAADAAGGLPISDAGGLDMDAILADTADMQPKLGTPAGVSISADIAAIEAQTDDIGAAGAGLSAVPWNAAWDAEVQSEVADALAVFWTSPATLVDLVWDEATAGHAGAGTTGKALTDAGSAGDPWSTTLPGAYGAGTAGKIVGDNINATVSSRASQTSVDTIDDFLDTEVAAILAAVDTEVGDIKTKTDQLTFTTANQVDATTVTIATGAISAAALAADAGNEIADAILDRNMATGTDSGSTTVRTARQALRLLRNKTAIAAGTMTVNKEDDATASWTAAITTSAGDPISAIDPAGP